MPEEHCLTGNKGEWSEPYVVLKVMADGRLCQANEQWQASEEYAVVKCVRREDTAVSDENGTLVFKFCDDLGEVGTIRVNRDKLKVRARRLYNAIMRGRGRAFRIPEFEDFLVKCGFRQVKNPVPESEISVKRDIQLLVRDQHIGPETELGFSVKSYLGSAPSLLNHSGATTLKFRLYGFTDSDMNAVNQINGKCKLIERCDEIKRRASSIRLAEYRNDTFRDNLALIDGDLPNIIASAVYAYYFDHVPSMEKVIERLNLLPEYVDRTAGYCGVKIKRFLRACALGMMPSQPWNDVDEASGGYVVVQPSGEVVAFYVYDRRRFDDYLVKRTRFDRPSTHKGGKLLHMQVYKEGNKFFVDLRLQIRFK